MKKFLSRFSLSIIGVGMVVSMVSFFVPAEAAISNWQKGGTIVSTGVNDFSSDTFKQSVRNLQTAGANYVTLVIPYYQSNNYSTDIAPGWNTPTDSVLGSSIDFIHSLGMKVMIKPHVESYGGGWRAYINPSDRNTWFSVYGGILNHLADISKTHNVEGITVGAELISMSTYTTNSNNTQAWITLINNVRSRYSGFLTYSANWGASGFEAEVDNIGFWPQLDYIGISAYYNLSSDGTVQGEMNAWDMWRRTRIEPLRNKYNKPILFTEIGYRSLANARDTPWESSGGGTYSATEQANLYEALFKYWNNYSYFAGFHLWHWSSNPNDGGSGNIDYLPQNKPAQEIMKQYLTGSGGGTTTPPPTGTSTDTTTPPPTGTWGGQASISASPQQGNQSTVNVTLTSTGSASDVISDLEVYDQANTKVFQKFFDHQTISSSKPGQYQFQWTPTQTGQYALKVGVFSNDWSKNYYWNNSLLTFSVSGSTPPPTTPPPTGTSTDTTPPPQGTTTTLVTTNIWWPTDGGAVQGVQPLKAMLEGKSVSDYTMYWQVDGDRLNEMANSTQDYPHKESLVDVSGWNWKGSGPYVLNFVSKDRQGNSISQKSINISVQK